MTGDDIGIVLFDLGGVLVDVGGVSEMRSLTGIGSDDELWARWLASPWVRRFERGHCSADDFAAGMVVEWELGMEPGEFLGRMKGFMSGAMPGVDELLRQAGSERPIGCLSNINSLHWDVLSGDAPGFELFTYRFLSFELGLVKPDAELFAHIAAAVPEPPERVLFLDDNTINVDAATAAGFTARRVQGVAGARAALVEAGVLAG